MPGGTRFDTTDEGTLRPNAKPLEKAGNEFKPMKLEEKYFEINIPEHAYPNDPITLWGLYYPLEIIDIIVLHTNERVRNAQDPHKPQSRAN
jgi:hypothetical protein